MTLLIAGLVLFIVTHLIRPFAPGLRNAGIAALGKPAWMALHGILSLASLVLIAYGFVEARANGGAMLYSPPIFMAHIALTLMLIASICLVAGFLPAGHIRTKLKFPILVAIKIWALAHLLANGESYSVLLFVTILAWAVILRISLKKRIAAGGTKLPVFVSAKNDLIAVVVGLALYVVIVFWLHLWVIKVSPLP
ncbi:NnrU family protein [Shinella sp.]|uniref:NnrU family protein n=1 Tax=Shinella sp. TaxID=1870904 RepID=UPI0029A23785|nr:NnrU family protein [Shinella sp.]MDX3978883.1 NnrU family protein [Shinella sp.]